MERTYPHEDRYPMFLNFVLSCWNQTAVHSTIPEAADEWVSHCNDGMIRLLGRELRGLLADNDLMAELADRKHSDRLAMQWAGGRVDAEDVRILVDHIGAIIETRSVQPGWWDRSKREADAWLEAEKQRPR